MNPIVVGIVAAFVAAPSASAQSRDSVKRYPVIPRPLPDSEELELARSAAPAEISHAASVYTMRDGKPHLLVTGTNGCACMVSRDLHEGSLYPICFDVEASKSVLPRELMEVSLRSLGRSGEQVIRGTAGGRLASACDVVRARRNARAAGSAAGLARQCDRGGRAADQACRDHRPRARLGRCAVTTTSKW